MSSNEPSPPSRVRPRFVALEYVQQTLSISRSQAYALVRSGELRAIQVGGRGQWRVELSELDAYIERAYARAARDIADEDPSPGTQ